MKITASATIGGKKTNRVRMRATSPGTARKRYRKDPELRGLDTVAYCASAPIEDLEEIDRCAERAQMSRSAWLRKASKHFAEKVFGGLKAVR